MSKKVFENACFLIYSWFLHVARKSNDIFDDYKFSKMPSYKFEIFLLFALHSFEGFLDQFGVVGNVVGMDEDHTKK